MYFSSLDQQLSDMTLQVGFVARDGLIIASDCKATSGFRLPDIPGTRSQRSRSAGTRKIFSAQNGALVCASSGSDASFFVAKKLAESAPSQFESDADVEQYLGRCNEFGNGLYPKQELIIVGIPNPHMGVSRLWRIFFLSDSQALIHPITSKLYGGDETIASVFFGEQYYDQSRSTDELQLLAAHIILEGQVLNSFSVHGLDIFVARDGEFPRFLDQTELDTLVTRSAVIHDRLVKELF